MPDGYKKKDEASLIQQGYSQSSNHATTTTNNTASSQMPQEDSQPMSQQNAVSDAYSASSTNSYKATDDVLENQAEHINYQLSNKNELAKESLVRRMLWGQYEKVNNNIHVDEEGNVDLNDEFE